MKIVIIDKKVLCNLEGRRPVAFARLAQPDPRDDVNSQFFVGPAWSVATLAAPIANPATQRQG